MQFAAVPAVIAAAEMSRKRAVDEMSDNAAVVTGSLGIQYARLTNLEARVLAEVDAGKTLDPDGWLMKSYMTAQNAVDGLEKGRQLIFDQMYGGRSRCNY